MAITLDVSLEENHFAREATGEQTRISRMGPGCRQQAFAVERVRTQVFLTATAQLTGFKNPYLRFEANGVWLGNWFSVHEWAGRAVYPGSDVSIPAQVRRPVAYRQSELVELAIPMHFGVGFQPILRLYNASWALGEGRFDVTVRALAAEGRGDDASAVVAEATATFETQRITLPEGAAAQIAKEQAQCILGQLEVVKFTWPPPLEKPGWQPRDDFEVLLRRFDFATVGPDLVQALRGQAHRTPAALIPVLRAAAALGVSVATLEIVGAKLRVLEPR